MYKIIALIGKAGSGKDTIMKKVLAAHPLGINEIISCTTRPKRDNEVEGINYFYLTNDQFTYKILNGEMIEATCFNGWHYGTSYDTLRSDFINIGVFNPDGIHALLQDKNIELKVFYINADDKVRMLRQLNREENPNVNEIVRRFQTDEEDFQDLEEIKYIKLINNTIEDLDMCVNSILDEIN